MGRREESLPRSPEATQPCSSLLRALQTLLPAGQSPHFPLPVWVGILSLVSMWAGKLVVWTPHAASGTKMQGS